MNIESIKAYLIEEGFRPQLDEDGDISFKYEGKIYYVQTNEADEEFVRILASNIWPLDDAQEKKAALRIANKATRRFKVAKVFLSNTNNVCVTVELFLFEIQTFMALFYRSISLLDETVLYFRTNMRKKMQKLSRDQQEKQHTPVMISTLETEVG